MGEDQLDDLELDGPITLRILDGTAWDFTSSPKRNDEVMEDREVWRLKVRLDWTRSNVKRRLATFASGRLRHSRRLPTFASGC